MAKLVCTLEMSKERGVTITVANADGKITQTLTMDGTSVTLVVKKGESEESSWTQKAESIAISCKDFSLVASNSISCKAAKTATYASTDGDTTITSGAKIVQEATGDVEVSGSNIKVAAQTAASMKGTTVEVAGTQSLALKGTVEAKLEGAKVAVKAQGQLALESSGMATLKGSMTTIGGSLIKAG